MYVSDAPSAPMVDNIIAFKGRMRGPISIALIRTSSTATTTAPKPTTA